MVNISSALPSYVQIQFLSGIIFTLPKKMIFNIYCSFLHLYFSIGLLLILDYFRFCMSNIKKNFFCLYFRGIVLVLQNFRLTFLFFFLYYKDAVLLFSWLHHSQKSTTTFSFSFFMFCIFISLGTLRFCAYYLFSVALCNGIAFFTFLVLGVN